MAIVKLWMAFECEMDDGMIVRGGSLAEPVQLTIGGASKHIQSFAVAAAGTSEIFDTADDISDFEFLWVVSDVDDVILELVTDSNAGVGRMFSTVELKANVPFVLASDDSCANLTYDIASGSLDVIDRLFVKNNQSTATANITVIALS